MDPDELIRYLHQNYAPNDWFAVWLKNPNTGHVRQHIMPVAEAATPEFQREMRKANAHNYGIFVSVKCQRQ